MKHLKRVLCAVDIDERHRHVFAHALSLARQSDASLLIVHAASPVRPLNQGATERVDFLRQLRAAAEAAGVDVRVTVQRGDVAGVILLHARARRPDLVVVGAGSNSTRVNSIAERVVREATCQTLVIPHGHGVRPRPFDTILCAVDLTPPSRSAAQEALRLATHRDRRVILFHVVDGPAASAPSHYPWLAVHEYSRGVAADALEQLQNLIPAPARGRVLARVAVGNPIREILDVARTTKADLLVIGAQPRSNIGRRLFGRTGLLLRQASCPVLAIPEPPHASADELDKRRKVAA